MRYSRIKKGRNQRRYASAIITLILIFGALYLITAGTMGKYLGDLISPILKSKGENHGTQDPSDNKGDLGQGGPELKLPEGGEQGNQENLGEEDEKPKATETIKVDSMNLYGLQMGAFNNKENAQSIADQLRTKGGAGYVLEDQYQRVMAMMFLNEADANVVKEQLKGQSVEAQIYDLKCPGVDMEITASKEKIEGIRSSFAMLKDKMGSMETLIKDLDNDKITVELALNRLSEMKDEAAKKAEELNGYLATNEGNSILSGLKALFSVQVQDIDQIIQEKTSDKVAISSKIKYTYIDMVVKYKAYIEQIINHRGDSI